MSVTERVRSGISVSTRRRLASRRVRVRQATSFARPMPSFMIIGTQRGGTSSLYKYLERHPDLDASIRKETEYFSRRSSESEGWYRAHFGLVAGRGGRRLAFEATPDYLFYPSTAERVAERLPGARFIVLLRDPVERAYSHYRHMVRLGFEELSFDDALACEAERIAGDEAELARDPSFFSRDLLRFSYATRGRYADQLERWFAVSDPSRFLILRSEDLFEDPAAVVAEVIAFLGVRPWSPRSYHNFSREPVAAGDRSISSSAAALLKRDLEPEVRRLEDLLGRSMGWRLGTPRT